MNRVLCRAAVALSLLAASAPRRAEACAGCRNPTLPATRGSEGPLDEHALRLGASFTGTTVHVVHEAGCVDPAVCTETPAQPLYLHDQHLYPLELRITGEYGIDETFGVEIQVPLRAVKTTIDFTTPDGRPFEPLDPDVHHRDETVLGPADPWLLLRVGTLFQRWWLAARPGVTIPIGTTEENPFALGDRGIRHQHIQLGSGTFDPVLVLEAARTLNPIRLQFFAQGQVSLYENSHGYRAPLRLYGGAAVGADLVGGLAGSLGPEALYESAERWNGRARQDGNLGRSELLAAASLTQALGDTVFSLAVRVPFFRHIVAGSEDPGTLESPLVLTLGVAHVFGEEHDPAGH